MQGVVTRFLDNLQTSGGLSGSDIANVVDVSKATVSRWRTGQFKPQPQHEVIIAALFYVVDRLHEYYSSEEVRTWLYARHPQLNGERAIDLIHDNRTIEVLKVIDRLDNDVFV